MPDAQRRRLGRRALTPGALLFLLALPLQSAESFPAPHQLDVPPRFQSRPRIEDIFPARALERAVSGVAQVQCISGKDGRARDCRITRETPLGWGFGQAALDGMAQSILKPGEIGGQPVETQVVQPFTFVAVDKVELDCALGPDQRVEDCRVVDEGAPGRGLGRLALRRAETTVPGRLALDRARDGRFRWALNVEAPLEDCPLIDGRPECQQPPAD